MSKREDISKDPATPNRGHKHVTSETGHKHPSGKPVTDRPPGYVASAYERTRHLPPVAEGGMLTRVSGNASQGRDRTRSQRPLRGDYSDVIRPGDEVIFEIVPRGTHVLITAMHAPTLTEASAIGPASAAQHDLERLVMGKLAYVLRRKRGDGG